MSRGSRQQCESNIYHVYTRGTGHQLIFEDDADRGSFLGKMADQLAKCEGDLLAWALMGNHVHLLLRMPIDVLSGFMRRLKSEYAHYFNKRHGHDGHLFQGRFGSQPMESDEQLMACVRYIHNNPFEAGISSSLEYKWSSYRSYLQGAAVTETSFLLKLFGGVGPFVEFHQKQDDGRFAFLDIDTPLMWNADGPSKDEKALEIADGILGEGWRSGLDSLSRDMRDECLRQLKQGGLSIRQIERLTGIGRGIISRA